MLPPFSFTVYNNLTVEICKRLHEFEEIRKRLCEREETEISRQICVEVTVNSKEENS
jgi:hypothetical protein